jgi:prefoldin beta subunit
MVAGLLEPAGGCRMDISKETSQKIQELQIIEQHLQSFLAQKQTLQIELNEATNALQELGKTSDEVYKILSGVMIKADKESTIKELEEKKKLLDLRVDSIEKQEKTLESKALEIRNEVTASMHDKKTEE